MPDPDTKPPADQDLQSLIIDIRVFLAQLADLMRRADETASREHEQTIELRARGDATVAFFEVLRRIVGDDEARLAAMRDAFVAYSTAIGPASKMLAHASEWAEVLDAWGEYREPLRRVLATMGEHPKAIPVLEKLIRYVLEHVDPTTLEDAEDEVSLAVEVIRLKRAEANATTAKATAFGVFANSDGGSSILKAVAYAIGVFLTGGGAGAAILHYFGG